MKKRKQLRKKSERATTKGSFRETIDIDQADKDQKKQLMQINKETRRVSCSLREKLNAEREEQGKWNLFEEGSEELETIYEAAESECSERGYVVEGEDAAVDIGGIKVQDEDNSRVHLSKSQFMEIPGEVSSEDA